MTYHRSAKGRTAGPTRTRTQTAPADGRASLDRQHTGKVTDEPPGVHLPRRPRPLPQEEVGHERRERAHQKAAAPAEHGAREDAHGRHRLEAGDRREQQAAGCGRAASTTVGMIWRSAGRDASKPARTRPRPPAPRPRRGAPPALLGSTRRRPARRARRRAPAPRARPEPARTGAGSLPLVGYLERARRPNCVRRAGTGTGLAGCSPTRPCRAGARAHDAPCPSPPSSQRRAKASSTGR